MRLAFDTERLRARPFTDADAPAAARMAGDLDVARMTGSIPHPYGVESAEGWILTHWGKRRRRRDFTFALKLKSGGDLIGSAGLFKRRDDGHWEIGYMLGRSYWGQGYATEAARGVVAWGRAELSAGPITANIYADNPASGRVLEKAGFAYTGERSTVYCVARACRTESIALLLPAAAATRPAEAMKDAG